MKVADQALVANAVGQELLANSSSCVTVLLGEVGICPGEEEIRGDIHERSHAI
jgi:hypothetical protein